MATSDVGLLAATFEAILNRHLDPIKSDIRAIKQHGVSQDDLRNAVDLLRKHFGELQDTKTMTLQNCKDVLLTWRTL
eukprot:7367714-Pyramimonas_sp.AAC.1